MLYSEAVDITQNGISLLQYSDVYIDENDDTLSEIIEKKKFQPYDKEDIRFNSVGKKAWIALSFKNESNKVQEKILLFGALPIENIYFYDESDLTKVDKKGQAHPRKDHTTQLNYYPIRLEPYTTKRYYAKVYSDYAFLNFNIKLEDEFTYINRDREEQFINIFLIGFIFALMVYSFFTSVYAKDKSYFFYAMYLIPLLIFQMKFVGLTQIYLPKEWVELDMQVTIVRLYMLLITNALFAMYFLDIKRYKRLNHIFILFLTICIVSMFLFNNQDLISFGLTLSGYLGIFIVFFNLTVAFYVYSKGYKQARLYIAGFMVVFISYLFFVSDSFGFTSSFSTHPNLFLWTTAFEALILSLAFADRYMILQKEKEETYRLFLQEARDREKRVAAEVREKTKQLSAAIENKELLLQEVHHRVKNNLQIILSLIHLQSQDIEDKECFSVLTEISNRVSAIAKTYEMLIVDDDLQKIDMYPYMQSLVKNIQRGFENGMVDIELVTDINVSLPLKEAAYIGLIANEIITNSYKYAFDDDKGKILIAFNRHEDTYKLVIEDNGKGFDINTVEESLGLKLINVLVLDQLKGNIDFHSNSKTWYEISFTLPQNARQI
ncbi:MAG: 7TM diverse intracellular signaling domain-containing protein [Sulfurimonas sp.]